MNELRSFTFLTLTYLSTVLPLQAAISFTEQTLAAGISHTHSHQLDMGPDAEVIFHSDTGVYHWMSGGAVAEDFNGDGWMDLYVLQGGSSTNLLYINQGDGTFIDEATVRGADIAGFHMGATAADYDRDGDIDIIFSMAEFDTNAITHYTASESHLVLLKNEGDGFFFKEDISGDLGPLGISSPSLGDIDNDGSLDLIVGSWEYLATTPLRLWKTIGDRFIPHITLTQEWCLSPRFADIDNDRDQDLLVTADFGHTQYYKNDGNGIFTFAGTSDIENGMGSAVGDLDNDGDLDWFMTSIRDLNDSGLWGETGNRMLLNDGSGSFSDVTTASGTRDGYWAWGAVLEDFDCDGDLDLYHVNGWPETDPIRVDTNNPAFIEKPALLFENIGSNTFQNIATAAGADDRSQGRCVVSFDYDNDGDQDLFIANNSSMDQNGSGWDYNPGKPVLLRNDSTNSGNWLKVSLQGLAAPHHSHGVGARVYATAAGVTQMRELNASTGYNGHGPNRIAHFGVGNEVLINEVRARWTNGDETIALGVATNQHITLTSPHATVTQRALEPGDMATFEIDAEHIPTGGSAIWTYSDSTFGNPASITFFSPGEHQIRVDLYDGDDPARLTRSEIITVTVNTSPAIPKSMARLWNEQNMAAIRIDFPDPTVHARNLFHTSVAMYDAWAAYTSNSIGYLHAEPADTADITIARDEAVSFAAYRILHERYKDAINGSTTLASLGLLMNQLGYDKGYTSTTENTPAALGNRIAETVLNFYSNDGANNPSNFLSSSYTAVNDPLAVSERGTSLTNHNRWQPLLFEEAITQNGQTTDILQTFQGANWGAVRPFAHPSLESGHLYYNPGPPPQLGGNGDSEYKSGNLEVIWHSSILDPNQGIQIDISPGAQGNSTLGTNDGTGRSLNPATGQAYLTNWVNRADFGRVLAEFWADGPASETPPGHWNVLSNEMVDHPDFQRRYQGIGPELPKLEWDVKMYFAINAALHDAAIAAWGSKRVYDYIRPVSSIRYMGGLGQSSDPAGSAYHPLGLPLSTGLVEVITIDSSAPGERHEHLLPHMGKIAIYTWAGVDQINPEAAYAGCDWILAEDWLPYQRDTFVTPAFAGYVSGHSAFSRAAAEVLTQLTGSEFFPGGMATFTARKDEFLEFEAGPTTDIELQWATFFDAADQAGLSRLYGGIHVPADDGPGRIIGAQCGLAAWDLAERYFDASIAAEPVSARIGRTEDPDQIEYRFDTLRGSFYRIDSGINLDDLSEQEPWTRAEQTFEVREVNLSGQPEDRMFFKAAKSHDNPAAPED